MQEEEEEEEEEEGMGGGGGGRDQPDAAEWASSNCPPGDGHRFAREFIPIAPRWNVPMERETSPAAPLLQLQGGNDAFPPPPPISVCRCIKRLDVCIEPD